MFALSINYKFGKKADAVYKPDFLFFILLSLDDIFNKKQTIVIYVKLKRRSRCSFVNKIFFICIVIAKYKAGLWKEKTVETQKLINSLSKEFRFHLKCKILSNFK